MNEAVTQSRLNLKQEIKKISLDNYINELPLAWISSYLSERSASVLFHSSHSRWRPTPFGLPLGSVLGPLLYILFTTDNGPLLASCSLASHSYADDVQAYKHCIASQAHSAIRIVSHATDTLNAWMSSNRLLLNPQKSQYFWFGTHQQLDKLDLAALSLEFPILSSLPLSGTWGSSLTRSYLLLSTSPPDSLLLLPLTPAAGGLRAYFKGF